MLDVGKCTIHGSYGNDSGILFSAIDLYSSVNELCLESSPDFVGNTSRKSPQLSIGPWFHCYVSLAKCKSNLSLGHLGYNSYTILSHLFGWGSDFSNNCRVFRRRNFQTSNLQKLSFKPPKWHVPRPHPTHKKKATEKFQSVEKRAASPTSSPHCRSVT